MGLNDVQATNVIPHIVNSIVDIERALLLKAILVGIFDIGSSKGNFATGYSSGFAATHSLGEAFTYMYNSFSHSSYHSGPSAYSEYSSYSGPSRSSTSGVYYLGNPSLEELELDVIVCFENGTYKNFKAYLLPSERYFSEQYK